MNFNETVKATTKAKLGNKVESKGGYDYVSWANSVFLLGTEAPDFTFEVRHFPQVFTRVIEDGDKKTTEKYVLDGVEVPFCQTSQGFFVEVSVTVDKITRTQIHPVLDNRNKPIANPSSFQINTSIQRCLSKATSLFGFALSLWIGEDLEDIE